MDSANRDQLAKAGAGYLLCELAELAVKILDDQSLSVPAELSDEQLGEIGKAAGIDERICMSIADNLRKKFKKSWAAISEKEWSDFKSSFPETADYIDDALMS